MRIETKLPKVGTTIFATMSQLAAEHGAAFRAKGEVGRALEAALRACGRLLDAATRAEREAVLEIQAAALAPHPIPRSAAALTWSTLDLISSRSKGKAAGSMNPPLSKFRQDRPGCS